MRSFFRGLAPLAVAAWALLVTPSSFAALSLGPEVDLSPPTFSPNGESQYPSVATNGTDYLVAWQDHISGAVFCARVTAAGAVLDKPAVALALQGAPAVFWDGAQYLVMAGTQGQKIDPTTGSAAAAFTLAGLTGTPALAFGGGGILAVVTSNTPLQATLFDETGAVVHPAVTLSTDYASTGLAPVVAYGAGEFLVAWTEEQALGPAVARVSSAGALLDSHAVPLSGVTDGGIASFSASELNVAGSPSGFLVSWYDARDTGIYAARVTAAGVVSDPGGFAVVSGTWSKAPAGVAWTGTEWWVSALGSNQIDQYVTTVSAAGATTSPSFFGFGSSPPQLAANAGSNLTVIPTESYSVDGQISSAGSLAPGSEFTISLYLSPQTQVSVAASSRAYVASWREGSTYMAVRLLANGTPIDAAPISLLGPIWGSTPNGYLVFAGSGGSGYGMLLLPDGVDGPSTDGGVLIPPTDGFYGPMTCSASVCVGTVPPNGGPWEETILPLGPDAGAYEVTPFPGTACTGNGSALATSGTGFLFVCSAPSAVPIAANGSAGAPNDGGLAGLPDYNVAHLTWGSHEYLLLAGTNYVTMNAYRLDADGTYVAGPQPLPLEPTWIPSSDSVAWDGRAFVIVGQGASAPAVTELAEDAVDGGTVPTATPLFAAVGTPGVASIGSAGALAVADQPRGSSSTSRAIARWITLADDDAGTDGGPDATVDAGDAGDGAPGPDADASSDAGPGDDAGPSSDAQASPYADASPSTDASPDAGSSDGGDAGSSSGCGCVVAGGGSGGAGPLALLSGIALVIARRRPRPTTSDRDPAPRASRT